MSRDELATSVSALVATFLAGCAEDVGLCEDCGDFSDLGRKCRRCYRAWSSLLWQDVGPEHRRLLATLAKLREHPQKHGIAEHAERGRGEPLSNDAAELLADVQRCIDGPFEDSMRAIVHGLATKASPERAR